MKPLITPEELNELLASNADVVVIDARANGSGPLHADLETQLSAARDPGADPARGGRHPLPPLERWTKQLGEWGIGPETHVVIYDDQFGANAAARAWWMLRAVGHERVQVVDGRWNDGSRRAESPSLQMAYPADRWLRPTIDLLRVDRSDLKVLDVRSAERYRGETEPIDPIAGHIPGALNLPFAENLDNGRFKAPHALREMYEQLLGDTPIEKLVVHCGSGVTACHTLLALEAAGLDGASLYVGSWSEWCRQLR
ncbi:MAG TPA: sulfurtransferase [Thermoanaerobaculia bacterium]|nr:sulfurtransferase [Thermoanaerobaculia bacterium]